MQICDLCKTKDCGKEPVEGGQSSCLIGDPDFFEKLVPRYAEADNREFFIACSQIEAKGYCEWPRLREVIELAKKMGYVKVGIAFCVGLQEEARIAAEIMRTYGLEIVSAACKTGGIPKERVGIPKEAKIHPDAFEVMCNPIAQAELLNREKTDFNVLIGLCVGHDSLFIKYSNAMVTTLVAKDRVLAHNPAGAIYCSGTYFKSKL